MLGTKGEGRAEAARKKKNQGFFGGADSQSRSKKSFAFPPPFPREIHALTALLHQ